ncbi:major facilitator superfamily domain-containing protein [Lentinula aff. detonsa]|uniref:Major facilitator superfamily domain-containing protein n=1 Tax=Lentinula aff. detonsa TaxID=2804958 RepID=A0AA38NPA8_9AGAR|nr:major facilitator superfamily domain-containing protein [Lentinula aff. detonsa]
MSSSSIIQPRTPLPKLQLFLILLIQVTEPITAEVIYPFIIGAVRNTGITCGDEKKTGYYAGVIESMFFLSECCTVYYWGRLSDIYGRRTILLIGPLGLTLAMLGFGLSKTFLALVIFRALQGIFNGNIGVSKTVMAEITDSTNMADAFTMIPIMWSFGSTVGPALGGILANPATQWPQLFGKFVFFRDFPYFLACAAAGLLAFVAFALSCIGLKESSPTFKNQKMKNVTSSDESEPLLLDDETQSNYGSSTSSGKTIGEHAQPLGVWELLTGDLWIVLLNYSLLSFTDMSYFVLIPLVYSSSISIGGLGLSPYQVGSILGIFAFLNGFWNLFVLTKILKKLGPRKMYIISYSSFLVIFPLLWILRDVAHLAGGVNVLVWILLVCQLLAAAFINTAYNSMSLLVVQIAPPNALGSVNGLAQMAASGTRGLAPLFASSLFSLSLESRIAGGHLVDIVLIVVSALGLFCSFQLPKHGFQV